LKATADMF